MKVFFIVGIVLNVVLTGLALYWLWQNRARKSKDGVLPARAPGPAAGESTRDRE